MTWDSKALPALRHADVETVAYLPDGAVAPLVEWVADAFEAAYRDAVAHGGHG